MRSCGTSLGSYGGVIEGVCCGEVIGEPRDLAGGERRKLSAYREGLVDVREVEVDETGQGAHDGCTTAGAGSETERAGEGS